MTLLHGPKAVGDWLDQLGVDNLVVMSPHLDDAVYSVAGIVGAAQCRTEVITLFTEAVPGQSSDWARAAGFADNEAEHLARRQEDVNAMNRLGCQFQHLGLRPGEASEATASQVVKAIERSRSDGLGRTLVLLPAGAGGPPPRSKLWRLALRAVRRPSGAMPHGEHEQIRDCFWQALAASQARVGFYAELPYAWAHSELHLQQHLHRVLGCRTERIQYQPDLERKMGLVELYRSQLVPIFGKRPAYRRRVLARNECIYVVDPHTFTGRYVPSATR